MGAEMRPLDLKTLIESSEKVITLGAGDVRVRRVSRTEFQSLMPPRPEPYLEWEKAIDSEVKALAKEDQASRRADLLVQRELDWLESLSPTERVTRREETLEGLYRVIARASLEPVLTVDLVKRLGDEAFTLLAGIQEFWKADEQAEKNGAGQTVDAVENAA
jgi:hypothetical protein